MNVYRRKYKGRDGKAKTGKTWWALYYVGGRRFHESLGTRDRRAAELIANERMRREELRRAGIADPFEESHEKTLADHLADFEQTLRARGVVARYATDRLKCLQDFFNEAGALRVKDLDLTRASARLSSVRATGVGARTVNRHRAAIRQFGTWLVKTRRVAFDPFEGLKPLNEEADRRHVRRALTPEEAERLLDAARQRPLQVAETQRIHAGVTPQERLRLTRLGETRALVYALALGTGLRRGEILRLRWQDVDLEARRVTVSAASAKSRKAQSLPLHVALAATLLASRPAGVSPSEPIVPSGAFPTIRTFWADLAAAGIAREDAEGRVIDFHALRTTFVSWLAMNGVHPRVAQALARHASVETTMSRYTDLALVDLKGTVDGLPLPEAPSQRRGRPIKPLRTWDRRGEQAQG
jgi:integrase